jgi:endo-1,4-beta-xylanase
MNGRELPRWISLTVLLLIVPGQIHAGADSIQTNVPALKDVFAHDFKIGCMLSYRHVGFPSDPSVPGQSEVVDLLGGYLLKFHMNSMTPGNNMKAQFTVNIDSSASAYRGAGTQANRDSIDIHPVVRFNGDIIAQLNWARRQGFTFRGHTLVWHNQTPAEFFRSGYTVAGTRLSKAVMIQRMDSYIHDVIRLIHEGWPGLLSAMDVVNEVVNDDTGSDRTDSEWYTTFGDNTYVMKAFELARKYTVQYGETQMKLYYNEYNTDYANKADGVVRLCTPIFQAGYLDGIGIQGNGIVSYPTATAWIAAYNKFYPICAEMSITEYHIDVDTTNPTAGDFVAQANQYAMLFKCYLDRSSVSGRGKIVSVTKAGLNDKYDAFPKVQSSLWDSTDQCKPTFYAIANVGMNYHALDSLISYANTLHGGDYTISSWRNLSAALVSAKNAMAVDYSASVSAASALGVANDNLKTAIRNLVQTVVKAFALAQNYPNPFNPTTVINYQLPATSTISLKLYDLLGQEKMTLSEGIHQPGNYNATLDARGLASGVYFYRLLANEIDGGQANSYVDTKKLMVLK